MPEAPCPITRNNEEGDDATPVVVLRVKDVSEVAMVLQKELNRGMAEDGVKAVGGEDDAIVRVRGSLNKMLLLGRLVVLPSIPTLRVRNREGGEASDGATKEGVLATMMAASTGGGRRPESTINDPCGDDLRISTNRVPNEAGVGNRQHTVRRGAGCCLERDDGEIFGRGGKRKRQGRALLLLLPLIIVDLVVAIERMAEGRKEGPL